VDRGIHADDGIMTFYGGSNHNYYWYQEENADRFWLIPWDMYSTFSISTPLENAPLWDQSPGDCGLRYPSYTPHYPLQAPGCDKLIHGFTLLDRSRYIAAVQRLLDGPFQLDAMNAKLDRWKLMSGGQADLVGAGVKAIHFRARADSNRALRVDVASPRNPKVSKGVCIGWDVNLSTQTQEFVVTLDTGAIPDWRLSQSPAPPTTDRNAVYQNATGITFRPHANGVAADGFFPSGVRDPGFVEIDDISFVTQ
jgi:hypothetical protein